MVEVWGEIVGCLFLFLMQKEEMCWCLKWHL